MNIAFVAGKPSFGGGERIFNMLMEELAKRGHKILLYTWEKEWISYSNSYSYQINVLSYAPIGLKGKIRAFKELKSSLLADKPNCLIVFTLGLAEIAVFVARFLRIPVICSERVDPRILPTSRIHRFLRDIIYRLSARIVFQTKEVKQYFPFSINKKGIVIPNPIMDDKLPMSDLHSYRKEIVAIGRLSSEKNFDMLIDAFHELSEDLNEYKLRIFGNGPLYQNLKVKIDKLGLNENVFLEGQVDRVVDYIRDADIFVLTSNHEGMPNALIESMAMGLACISTNFESGGAKALINDHENGILIPVNDKEALKKSLLELIYNEKFKLHLKHNAMKIRNTNAKDRIIPLWLNLLESVIIK